MICFCEWYCAQNLTQLEVEHHVAHGLLYTGSLLLIAPRNNNDMKKLNETPILLL
jgi:hypothetical protein